MADTPTPEQALTPDDSKYATFRLDMFEVYEAGSSFPLFVTSVGSEAYSAAKPGDTVVRRYWLAEKRPEVVTQISEARRDR